MCTCSRLSNDVVYRVGRRHLHTEQSLNDELWYRVSGSQKSGKGAGIKTGNIAMEEALVSNKYRGSASYIRLDCSNPSM